MHWEHVYLDVFSQCICVVVPFLRTRISTSFPKPGQSHPSLAYRPCHSSPPRTPPSQPPNRLRRTGFRLPAGPPRTSFRAPTPPAVDHSGSLLAPPDHALSGGSLEAEAGLRSMSVCFILLPISGSEPRATGSRLRKRRSFHGPMEHGAGQSWAWWGR